MVDNTRYAVILGSLLHDIGKFWQRADNELNYDKSQVISQATKKNIANICKSGEHGYTHKHSLWTAEFIEKYKDYIPNFEELGQDNIYNISSYHHNPNTPIQKLIQLSDWCSSGMDRNNSSDWRQEEEFGKYNFKKVKLIPVFEFLHNDYPFINPEYDSEKGKSYKRYNFTPLSLDKTVFPVDVTGNIKDETEAYNNLWKQFETDFKLLKPLVNEPKQYINQLLVLLKKYTWCIPSSTNDRPDISLYDHLRTTAAISTCLFEVYKQNPDVAFNKNKENYILLNGDITGIQSFIYKITTKAASKALKGKSFYLQLLIDSVATYLLHELDLPDCNLIYGSGGGFYALLPITALNKLKTIERNVNKFILEKFDGDLYLTFGYVKLTNNDFLEQKIADKWREVNIDVERKKKNKFISFINNPNFFIPEKPKFTKISDLKAYNLIEIEKELLKAAFNKGDKESDDTLIPNNYLEYIRLGKDIISCNYMISLINCPNIHLSGTNEYIFTFEDDNKNTFSIKYLFEERIFDEKVLNIISKAGTSCKVEKLNDLSLNNAPDIYKYKAIYSIKLYGGNTAPKDNAGYIKTLEEISGKEGEKEDKKSFNKISVLRMDVDNLGESFIKGFWMYDKPDGVPDKRPASISRIANLSFMLDWFFTGYINVILQKDKYKDKAYIVYAGGDDLFIVGHWQVIPDLAKDIYNEFREFACKNGKMTISGGIAMNSATYPIYKAAQNAGEYESIAKSFVLINDEKLPVEQRQDKTEKDAIYFISKPLRFRDFKDVESDFKRVEDVKQTITEIIEETNNSGILNKLANIYLEYDENYKIYEKKLKCGEIEMEKFKEFVSYSKWRWRAAYKFARIKRSIKSPELNKKIDKLVAYIMHNHDNGERNFIEYMDVAVRWAEFEKRTNNKKEK
jgi:CRISPR-associated protein Csm1